MVDISLKLVKGRSKKYANLFLIAGVPRAMATVTATAVVSHCFIVVVPFLWPIWRSDLKMSVSFRPLVVSRILLPASSRPLLDVDPLRHQSYV